MVRTDSVFAGSIPDVYDEYRVPLIFEPYAADMASRVAALNPATVLETAAGSGVVTRALAPRLAQTTEYVVTDLNPPMLERAKRQPPADNRIGWRQADALELPFSEDAFDVINCQFGVMFFPIRWPVIVLRADLCAKAGTSFSTCGIASQTTSSLTVLPGRARRSFRTIRHYSWHARPMAITMSNRLKPTCALPVSIPSRLIRSRKKAAPTARVSLRSPIAREHHCEMDWKHAMHL